MVGIGVGYVPGRVRGDRRALRDARGRTDEYIDAMRSVWHDDQPRYDGATVAFSGIQSYPRPLQRGGPPIHGSGMSRAPPPALGREGRGLLRLLPRSRAHGRGHRGARRARAGGRPTGLLGPLEITITPPAGPVDAGTVKAYEDLGVHRLVLERDFRDLAGAPDAARRGELLREMERTADELRLR